jgi:hypothetical protein
METIKSLNTYNTDTFNSWGIGHITKPVSLEFENILKCAIDIKATLIVKPSRGKFWYIKGINGNKSYEHIKTHLENNLNSGYKNKSKTWLISYI